MTSPAAPGRLLTPRFVLVVTCGLFYFLALAMLTPVIPHYVEDDLGYGSLAVGIAVGAFALGAIVIRAYFGKLGDRIGRRVLIIGGAAVVAVSTVFYGAVHALWWLIALRVVTGFGEAAFFVGAATMITDLAPVQRRGEAVSYWSVAVYGGLAFGPALGEFLRGNDRYTLTYLVSAGFAALAAVLALFTREVERDTTAPASQHLLHRAAVGPGFVLFLGLIPLAGYSAFLPLYADDDLGISSGGIFVLYGVLILLVRVIGARVPDQLGGKRAGSLATAGAALGIAIVALCASVPGVIVGTIVFAGGMSLMYPALLLLALTGVSDADRASVVGTFSSFFDASQGIGAFVCGAAAAAFGSDRAAFATGAVTAVCGLIFLNRMPARGEAHTGDEVLPA